MKVQVLDNEKVIWERDKDKNWGRISREYLKNGIQEKIIDNLKHALEQAIGQNNKVRRKALVIT
jgi:hypothetical protein